MVADRKELMRKKDIIINPFFISKIEFISELFFSILHKISLPKVMALIKLKESIVDIIVAIIPIRNKPKSPVGRTSNASSGYVNNA